ncbi:ABC transporter substrate-binding protein [Noviherbaspirillum cavernae]|uniref:ABC transporter substrate-binding protein n=1 Tax=Noviherbaspirillum cavernae TaxID=2320862 RepID=A0A418WZE9_9BURK|nr:ABC transporter substrate-binding protein [Noviherbaspirillum cavernae]RJG05620.1 ABC transporter substrate-binding protein [Noviherbaspirillum cavernae]
MAMLAGPVAGEPPRRVVSLDLCTDWLLARYAPHDRAVALSPLSQRWRLDGMAMPWPAHDGTLEQVLQFQPDFVITGQYNALLLRGRLQALGKQVEVLPLPTQLSDVAPYEKRVLSLLGLPEALASEPVAPAARTGSKRLLLLGANGIGTGRGTLEDEILQRAGWTNYLQDSGYVRLDLERIAVDPPDAVLWAAPASPALANRFAEHPVLKRSVPASRWLTSDPWRWQCPGPWTWELVRELRHALSENE